jgi:hypothetical protein
VEGGEVRAETWHPWWWRLLHLKRAADYRFQYRHARSHQLAEARSYQLAEAAFTKGKGEA